MTDTTMTTKFRQAEALLREMAAELGVPVDTRYDALQIGIHDGRFLVSVAQLEGYRFTSGDTLEEAHLKMLNPTLPF